MVGMIPPYSEGVPAFFSVFYSLAETIFDSRDEDLPLDKIRFDQIRFTMPQH